MLFTIERIIFFILILYLTGCATFGPWTELRKSEYRDSARRFTALVPPGWMRFNLEHYFIMTKDGTVLDSILVERHPIKKKIEFTKREYFSEMTPEDLADIEIDNFKANGDLDKFEVVKNKPVRIDQYDGFYFEYTCVAKGGLKKRGFHYGFLNKDWVYRIRYEAASQYYFPKYKSDFEQFIGSLKMF